MRWRTPRRAIIPAIAALALALTTSTASAQQKKPNIVVIFSDDVGVWNISA